MKVLITQEDGNRYSILNYKYKVLKSSMPDLPPVPQGIQKATLRELEAVSKSVKSSESVSDQSQESSIEDENSVSKETHNQIVDSLLKKADEFSEKYLKAQIQYEELLESTERKEELLRKSAYEEGLAEGLKQAQEQMGNEQNGMLSQMQESVRQLNQESEKFSIALQKVNEELIGAALDIAKEVIVKELADYSHQVTSALAHKLIAEIDKESKIRLKVHPSQVDALQTAMGAHGNVTIEADNAVQKGGVIVISKLGTIEADIMSRYEQIKRNALNP